MHVSVLLLWWLFCKKQLNRNVDCKSLLQGLASGEGSVMIIGLLVNTGAKFGAAIYDLYTYYYSV